MQVETWDPVAAPKWSLESVDWGRETALVNISEYSTINPKYSTLISKLQMLTVVGRQGGGGGVAARHLPPHRGLRGYLLDTNAREPQDLCDVPCALISSGRVFMMNTI